MEYDIDRITKEAEKLNNSIRILLKGKYGPVIMTSLSFMVAESIINVSPADAIDQNFENFKNSTAVLLEEMQAIVNEEPHGTA